MRYRKLGTTDLDVSVICLGTMTFGEQNTQQDGFDQMDYALERGVNFFDTAELYAVMPRKETYGKTEEIIGNWFKEKKNRNKIILASKIASKSEDDLQWIREGSVNLGFDRRNMDLAIDNSLKRLKTDYIDLYQLHWANRGSYHFRQNWNFDPSGQKIPEPCDRIAEKLTGKSMVKPLAKMNDKEEAEIILIMISASERTAISQMGIAIGSKIIKKGGSLFIGDSEFLISEEFSKQIVVRCLDD